MPHDVINILQIGYNNCPNRKGEKEDKLDDPQFQAVKYGVSD